MQKRSNLIIFTSTILLSFFIAEWFLRLNDFSPSYAWGSRYLYSSPNLLNLSKNVVGYHKNRTIRNSAVYMLGNNPRTEYDYFVNTNNFGLVQSKDVYCKKPSIAFIGIFYGGSRSTTMFLLLKKNGHSLRIKTCNY